MPAAATQDLAGETGVVAQAFDGQHDLPRIVTLRQPLARERVPYRLVVEAGRVLAGHYRVSEMEMIAMRLRELPDRGFAPLVQRCAARHARDGLQERER